VAVIAGGYPRFLDHLEVPRVPERPLRRLQHPDYPESVLPGAARRPAVQNGLEEVGDLGLKRLADRQKLDLV